MQYGAGRLPVNNSVVTSGTTIILMPALTFDSSWPVTLAMIEGWSSARLSAQGSSLLQFIIHAFVELRVQLPTEIVRLHLRGESFLRRTGLHRV